MTTPAHEHPVYADFETAEAAVGSTLTDVLSPLGFFDYDETRGTETGTWVIDSGLVIDLPVPISQEPVVFSVGGVELAQLTGDTPPAGGVAFDWNSGRATFAATLEGETVTWTMPPRETPVRESFLHWFEAQLMATQRSLLIGVPRILATETGKSLAVADESSVSVTTVPHGTNGSLLRVRVVPTTLTGLTVVPIVGVRIDGVDALQPMELRGGSVGGEFVFEGGRYQPRLLSDAVLTLYVERGAVGTAYVATVVVEWVRES